MKAKSIPLVLHFIDWLHYDFFIHKIEHFPPYIVQFRCNMMYFSKQPYTRDDNISSTYQSPIVDVVASVAHRTTVFHSHCLSSKLQSKPLLFIFLLHTRFSNHWILSWHNINIILLAFTPFLSTHCILYIHSIAFCTYDPRLLLTLINIQIWWYCHYYLVPLGTAASAFFHTRLLILSWESNIIIIDIIYISILEQTYTQNLNCHHNRYRYGLCPPFILLLELHLAHPHCIFVVSGSWFNLSLNIHLHKIQHQIRCQSTRGLYNVSTKTIIVPWEFIHRCVYVMSSANNCRNSSVVDSWITVWIFVCIRYNYQVSCLMPIASRTLRCIDKTNTTRVLIDVYPMHATASLGQFERRTQPKKFRHLKRQFNLIQDNTETLVLHHS